MSQCRQKCQNRPAPSPSQSPWERLIFNNNNNKSWGTFQFNHVCNTVHCWTDTGCNSYGILRFFSVWVQNHKQTLFIWMDDLFNVKDVQWRCGDSVCLHGFWYMTCLYIWSAYWGERFPSSTRLPREPYFTWVIKNTEFVVYCKHTHTQREDGKMVSIGVTQRRCLTSGCWLSMVNFPQSSFDEETPHVPQQWNFSPHNLHIQSYLPGALNFLKLMLTRTKWMTVGQFFSPLFGLKT